MNVNAKLVAKVLGAVFVAVGIIGFIPNPLVSSEGYFLTNAAHNLVHLVTGLAFLVFGGFTNAKATMFLKVFGGVYLAVGLLGIVMSGGADTFHLLGFIHMNAIDNVLHLGLGGAIALLGFLATHKEQA